MRRWAPLGALFAAVLLGGCKTAPPAATADARGAVPGAGAGAGAGTGSAAATSTLTAAIAADARASEHTADAATRAHLAVDAERDSLACVALAPAEVGCLYYRGVAQGLAARAHPAHAGEILKGMLDTLGRAETADPGYDHAGPARVSALVLLRAPGWPLGPGDPEAAVAAARRAVSTSPDYPPNLLALAEALVNTGDGAGAHDYYRRALGATNSMAPGPERDEWRAQATQGLKH